jgi:hypothetical protein
LRLVRLAEKFSDRKDAAARCSGLTGKDLFGPLAHRFGFVPIA